MSWDPPARNGAPPVEVYDIKAIAVRDPVDKLSLHAHGTSLVVSGLNAGTQYQLTVAAKNRVGLSSWSVPVTAVTRSATARPVAPTVAPILSSKTACDSVHVSIPQWHRDCSSGEEIILEIAEAARSGNWREARIRHRDSSELVAVGFQLYTAYRFRFRARNALGLSDAGPASKAMLLGDASAALRRAPAVEALSSSTYRVTWSATAPLSCNMELTWRVEYRRTSDGLNEWQRLADQTSKTSIELELRCPTGCAFRVAPTNIYGWSEPSLASEPIASHQMHPPAHGAVRLELMLVQLGPASSTELQKRFERKVAEALKVSSTRVHVVELRDGDGVEERAVVFDLLPTIHTQHVSKLAPRGNLWAEPDPDALQMMRQLAKQLTSVDSVLRVSFDVDVSVGLLQLHEDGSVLSIGVWISPPPPAPAPPSLASTGYTFQVLLLIASLGCCYCCCLDSGGNAKATRSRTKRSTADDQATSGLLDDAPPSPGEIFEGSNASSSAESMDERMSSARLRAALHGSDEDLPSPRLEPLTSSSPAALSSLAPTTASAPTSFSRPKQYLGHISTAPVAPSPPPSSSTRKRSLAKPPTPSVDDTVEAALQTALARKASMADAGATAKTTRTAVTDERVVSVQVRSDDDSDSSGGDDDEHVRPGYARHLSTSYRPSV